MTLAGIASFTLILLLLITYHSAPHKKVTVVKDGHTFTHDLMNWRSRVLATSDVPESDGVGDGRERSCGVGVISGEALRGNGNNGGVGETKRSSLMTSTGATTGEAEVGIQFSVCKFENLGIMDNICRYSDCQSRVLSKRNVPSLTTECVPRRLRPN